LKVLFPVNSKSTGDLWKSNDLRVDQLTKRFKNARYQCVENQAEEKIEKKVLKKENIPLRKSLYQFLNKAGVEIPDNFSFEQSKIEMEGSKYNVK
jgi:hypothetical protein